MTPNQKQVLAHVRKHQEKYGFSQSYRTIGKALGISHVTVGRCIERLEALGHIQRAGAGCCGFIVIAEGTAALKKMLNDVEDKVRKLERDKWVAS